MSLPSINTAAAPAPVQPAQDAPRIDILGDVGDLGDLSGPNGTSGPLGFHESFASALLGRARLERVVAPSDGLAALVLPVAAPRCQTGLETLAELAESIKPWVHLRARRCEVGGLPLFAVLTNADRLAQPGDTLGDWLQRIETAKLELHQRLLPLVAPKAEHGFGSISLHVWATAAHRPELKDAVASGEGFGFAVLAAQVQAEAQSYQGRQARLPVRLQVTLRSLAALLASMLFLVGWLVREYRRPAVPAPPADPQPDRLAELQELTARGQRLLRFEGFSRAGAPTDWPRWYHETTSFQTKWQAERVHPALAGERQGQALVQVLAGLERLDRDLNALRIRAALFQLAGDRAERPGVLHIPPQFAIHQASERLQELGEHYPDFEASPLPGEVPLQVARELVETARANYEKLLEPARRVVVNRLKEASADDKETPEAWKKLAEGWLAHRAEMELADWLELARQITSFASDAPPADPIVELQTFLRRSQFDLPLGTVAVHIPENISVNGKKLRGLHPDLTPLIIRYQPPQGKEITPRALQIQRGHRPREPYVFLDENPRLVFEPGGKLSAQLRLIDEDANAWLLTWPAAEAVSPVYSFHVLTQAPRLHPEAVTDPTRGELAFDVRLILSQPELFELPDLFPR